MTTTPPSTPLTGPPLDNKSPVLEKTHSWPPTPPHPKPTVDSLPHSKMNLNMHHPKKATLQSDVKTNPPRRDSEHLYVRPLTPRDAGLCLNSSECKTSQESLEKLLHASSPTSLGIFTSDHSHTEKLLGFIIAEQSEPKDEAGEGATLWIKEVVAQNEKYKITLVKSFVERMSDAMVAKRLVMDVPQGEEGKEEKEWWCSTLGFTVGDMGDLVYYACF